MNNTYNPNTNNILKKKYLLTETEYQKVKMNEQNSKLNYNSKMENIQRTDEKINRRFYNLSLQKLFHNASNTYIEMINEFSLFINKPNKSFNDVMNIFVKNDRLIYVGILFIILAICFLFITITR